MRPLTEVEKQVARACADELEEALAAAPEPAVSLPLQRDLTEEEQRNLQAVYKKIYKKQPSEPAADRQVSEVHDHFADEGIRKDCLACLIDEWLIRHTSDGERYLNINWRPNDRKALYSLLARVRREERERAAQLAETCQSNVTGAGIVTAIVAAAIRKGE